MTVSKNTGPIEIECFYWFFLEEAQYRRSKSQILNHCIWGMTWQIKKRKTRNRDTFVPVRFFIHSATPFLRKMDQTILALSLSDLWFRRRYSVGISPPLTDASRIRSQLKVWSDQNFSTKRYNKNLEKINHVKKFRLLHQQVTGFSNFYRRFSNVYCASV